VYKNTNSAWAFLALLVVGCALHALIFIWRIPVYYLPDLILGIYLIYKLPDLNQDVSPLFFVGLILWLGYYFFSPPAPDTQYTNNFFVVLKPFLYLSILALYSKNDPQWSLRRPLTLFLYLYPCILLWNLFLVRLQENASIGQLMNTRPFFIFENNFEITFYLNCFAIVFFIYQQKQVQYFVLAALVIILSGSRSGLLSFAAMSVFYFLAVSWRQRIVALTLALAVVFYIGKGRNITAPLNSIDRVQSLQAILDHYHNSFWEILSLPFGHGIYEKIPGYICIRLPDFAEWFTGNSHNCDPLMLQAFYSRALFQFGIYITILIPLLFLLLVKKEMGWKLACIVLTPMTCVAASVGGFSNGLAFWGILLSLYAFEQVRQVNPALTATPAPTR